MTCSKCNVELNKEEGGLRCPKCGAFYRKLTDAEMKAYLKQKKERKMMTLYKSKLKSLQETAEWICNSLSEIDPRVKWEIIPGCIVVGTTGELEKYSAVCGPVTVWYEDASQAAWMSDVARRANAKLFS